MTKSLYQKILSVMEEVQYIQKEQTKVNGQYKPVSHNAVVAKLRPSLIKHGIIIVPSDKSVLNVRAHKTEKSEGYRSELVASYLCINVDNPEERLEISVASSAFDTLDKDVGKAISSGKKSMLLSMFLLETGEGEESQYSFEPPTQEQIKAQAPADSEIIGRIKALAIELNISEEIVGSAVGVEKFEDIPTDRAPEIEARMIARLKKVREAKAV